MADCECLPKCIFFNDKMANKPATAQLMKNQYCHGDNAKCARHMVAAAVGTEHVPSDLFPTQTDRVKGIVEVARSS